MKRVSSKKGLDDLLYEKILNLEDVEIEKRIEELRRRELKKAVKSLPERFLSPKKSSEKRIVISKEEFEALDKKTPKSSKKMNVDKGSNPITLSKISGDSELEPFLMSFECKRKLNSRCKKIYKSDDYFSFGLPEEVKVYEENDIDDILLNEREKKTGMFSRPKRRKIYENNSVLLEQDLKNSLPENDSLRKKILNKEIKRLKKRFKKQSLKKGEDRDYELSLYPEKYCKDKDLRAGIFNYKMAFKSSLKNKTVIKIVIDESESIEMAQGCILGLSYLPFYDMFKVKEYKF